MKPRLMNDCAVARTNWQKYMPRLIEIPRKDFFAFSQLFCFSAALVARSPVIHVDSGHDQHLARRWREERCLLYEKSGTFHRLEHFIAESRAGSVQLKANNDWVMMQIMIRLHVWQRVSTFRNRLQKRIMEAFNDHFSFFIRQLSWLQTAAAESEVSIVRKRFSITTVINWLGRLLIAADDTSRTNQRYRFHNRIVSVATQLSVTKKRFAQSKQWGFINVFN